jgi:hypothetical protein
MCQMQSTKVGDRFRRANCPLTFRSCSMPCFRDHAAQCTAGTAQPKIETAGSTAGVADAMRRDSFKAQAHQLSAAELGELFKRHSTLRTQLQGIYRATQRPEERPEENNSFRGRSNGRGRGRGLFGPNGAGDARHWTPDKGFDRGLKQLQRGLEQETGQGEALRVLAATILKTSTTKQPENEENTLGK